MLAARIHQSVEQSIVELLSKGNWRDYEGAATERLVCDLRRQFQVEHGGLCSSGTAALEIILRAAKISAGDEVLMAGYDYPGTFWAIERVGARPVLVDLAPGGWSLDVDAIDAAYQPPCRAVVISHLHGQLQPIDEIRSWCQQKNVLLIEDACQAVGATYREKPIGAWGDASFISFGGSKVLSAGRGGAFLTNDAALAQRARIAAGAGSGPYTMSQLQATAVAAQLAYLDEINTQCRVFFRVLNDQLQKLKINLQFPPQANLHQSALYQAGWLFGAQNELSIEPPAIPTAQQIVDRLASQGILAGTGFDGLHRRTHRRCRIAGDLSYTKTAAAHTFVLHHRLALEGNSAELTIATAIHHTVHAYTGSPAS